ncbi:MAG: SurA N-terminal domain-containing protein [Flavobacteriaceae bacterium]|nr:SurA N-terminal domain-containing protein [Flavobacteriaceae bacterium]
MAILSKIRERSMALILVIGLALFAFVLDPSSIQDFFNSTKINTVGEVGGETITRKEFSEALEAYKARVGNRITDMQASNIVWNNLVREKIYKTQLEEAGITVGENDVWTALIENPSIKGDQRFLNSAGLFDEGKLKEFLALAKDDSDKAVWNSWAAFMGNIKAGLENSTYNNLITAGLGASLKEGEMQYMRDNTKITAQYVFVPYTTVADSLIKVTKSDIEKYVKENPANFKVESSRDIKYVKFDIIATKADEDAIQKDVAELLVDNGVAKGFKNVEKDAEFFADNGSDLALNTNYQYKKDIAKPIVDKVLEGKKGDVFGPYKDNGFFKISKINEVVQIPDSVKGAHILVPFVGSASAGQDTKMTEAQAKKYTDSIFKLVRRDQKKFAAIADEINPDGTKGKGGDTDWLSAVQAYSLDKDFGDAFFFGKKGDIKVIKSKFGFHIIRVDESRNKQKAVKLATFGRKIEASQDTENTVFQNAQTFALALTNGQDFDAVVKEKKLQPQTAFGLKALDENVPGLGNERSIVTWAHNKENEVGAFKIFDTTNGHVVAVITNKTKKGLMSAAKAAITVRPILVNEKKAAVIAKTMTGATLNDIATATKQSVRTATNVTMQTPVITGVGFEPKILGAMYTAKENTVFNTVEGQNGVFAFVVTKREKPVTLPNYDTYRKRIAAARKTQTNLMYNAIKEAANVEDNRSTFYGIE